MKELWYGFLWLVCSALVLAAVVVWRIVRPPFVFINWLFEQCSLASSGCDYD